jgi:hypothetical protein
VGHADIISLLLGDEIKCTEAELFEQGVDNTSNYFVGTNENPSNVLRTGRSCLPRAVYTVPPTSGSIMPSFDDDEQSSSRQHVKKPAASLENRPDAAIHHTAAVCWPEGWTFLSLGKAWSLNRS